MSLAATLREARWLTKDVIFLCTQRVRARASSVDGVSACPGPTLGGVSSDGRNRRQRCTIVSGETVSPTGGPSAPGNHYYV